MAAQGHWYRPAALKNVVVIISYQELPFQKILAHPSKLKMWYFELDSLLILERGAQGHYGFCLHLLSSSFGPEGRGAAD